MMVSLRALLLSLLLIGCSQGPPDAIDVTGKPVYFAQYRGQWLFINVWADWCEPCLHEIPALNDFAKRHAGKAVVLGLNYDTLHGANRDARSKKFTFHYPLLRRINQEKFALETDILPVTYLFNPQGVRVARLDGPQTVELLEAAMK